jgi:tetratricopeptide (TPR) repeat protein
MDPTESTDIGDHLDDLFDKYDDLGQRCLNTSANRVAREAARRAREHRLLVPYLHAQFRLMNNAQGQLDAESGKESALEAIALLESEERARTFQADFPEDAYFETVAWMSACSYDNLAKHIASMQGYNSEGMHQCITDGMDVCRRTGKLRCITCFREYACDVYLSSDDVPMALHFARLVKALPEDAPNSERRWVGCKDETHVLKLLGNFTAAEDNALEALKLAESYHTPLEAKHDTWHQLETIQLLAGKQDDFVKRFGAAIQAAALPRGEWIGHDLDCDLTAALRDACQGDFKKAEETLVRWDRWLTDHKNLHSWFEVRLRLIACHRLAGNQARIEPLAKQLEERAWAARDWLTLHRLSRLFDPSETPSPLALLGPADIGPFAGNRTSAAVPAAPPSEAAPAQDEPVPEAPPLDDMIVQFGERLNGLEDDAGRRALLDEVLAVPTDGVTHPVDAARLLHLLQFVMGDDGPDTWAAMWRWAEAVAAPFPQVSVVLNLLASLGDMLRGADPALEEQIDPERLDRMFRESIDLDPFHARNHFRAGIWHLSQENFGEAERCLARGLRLERNFGPLALKLAEVYQRTDRPRDALMVLDTCLREGCDDPAVAWEAAVGAFGVDQFEPMLTYLDRHEQLQPGAPWINYYRACGLLELGRPAEALAAVEEEGRRAPENLLPQHLLRACAEQALGRTEEARRHVEQALSVRLADVDYLTFRGLLNLFGRLWNTAGAKWPEDDPVRQQLETRLLATGLAPDEFFDAYRERGEAVPGVHFYRCRVRQELDERWPTSPGCLRGQEEWPFYFALWGMLARDEDEAQRLALQWQARIADGPAEVLDCEAQDGEYKDKPGVIWQGQRWHEEDEAS